MNNFSDFLENLKNNLLLSNIIQEKVKLKRNGGKLLGCCPFHNEKTPSFYVDDNKGKFHCFGCGENGDAFDYVQKTYGLTLFDAAKYLAEKSGLPMPNLEQPSQNKKNLDILYQIMDDAANIMHENLYKTVGSNALSYLEKRKNK